MTGPDLSVRRLGEHRSIYGRTRNIMRWLATALTIPGALAMVSVAAR
jgi:hypothetical protein